MKPKKKIRLLVRADDAGSSLASNIGCLNACMGGIATSIEVMSPGGWVELRAMGHEGDDDVCEDRSTCLSVLLSDPVKSAIRHSDIELITYRQLQHETERK